MSTWSGDWLLEFHPDKLKKLTIAEKKDVEEERIYFVGEGIVKELTCEKDLGVIIFYKCYYTGQIPE